MKRDIHHHFIPEIVKSYIGNLPDWNPEKSIAYMKAEGIDKATLSLSDYTIDFESKNEYIRFCEKVNRELKNIVSDYPQYFEAFGILPFPHIDESISELNKCMAWGFSGMVLYTNVKGTYPSTIEHKRLFSAFNEQKVKLFIHPAATPLINGKVYDGISPFIEYLQEVRRLVSRFLTEDGFERFTGISYILAHGGGIFPYQFSRLGKLVYMKCVHNNLRIRWGRIIGDMVTKKIKINEYLKSMEFDLYDFSASEQLAALHTYVKPEKCLYGSNYPYLNG